MTAGAGGADAMSVGSPSSYQMYGMMTMRGATPEDPVPDTLVNLVLTPATQVSEMGLGAPTAVCRILTWVWWGR